ncbi:hypothetical protein BGW37DRAFT_499365 [Umbelopsis sp. PMI_123]|nr:hypothetical protein BGW37DRAFT_499365 [Umbelopsis sp. PMI_123]
MSVNVLTAPSSLSAVGSESQLDAAVHNLYKLYHTSQPSMNRFQSSPSRHHRSNSRTIVIEDDFFVPYGRENAHSIAQAPVLESKLNKLSAAPLVASATMHNEMVELIRNTEANARISMPDLTDSSLRRKPKLNDRMVSFNDSPEYINTPSSFDSDSIDSLYDSTEQKQSIPDTPPSPTKRAVRTLRNTTIAVVRGTTPDRLKNVPNQSRSRPVSAPAALSSDTQQPNHKLKNIGKWLTDKNKWLNADRTFLY